MALRYPYVSTFLLVMSLILAAISIPQARFDGNIINVVNQQSKAFEDFQYQSHQYRNFAGDTWLIIKNPRLSTARGLEELRALHLDLALEDNIKSVFSIFSLGDTTGGTGSFKPLMPDMIETDEQAQAVLAQILKDQPAASAIVSPEKNAAMLVVQLSEEAPISEKHLSDILYGLKASAINLAPPDFEVMMSGYPVIRMSIVEAIIKDQTILTIAGIIIGALVSLAIFGNFSSALICTIPPAVAIAWILATFSMTGIKLNFLTTVLPTLALIIAFADSIVIYFRWQSLNGSGHEDIANLEEALWRVGPASSLTSITTALAFLSFIWASSATMGDFALFGVMAVALAFLAVMIGLPVACYWSSRFKSRKKPVRAPAFGSFGNLVSQNVLRSPALVISASLILLAVFTWIHLQLQPSYTTSSNLPYDSEIRVAEEFSDTAFGGTSQYLIIVPVSAGGNFSDAENRNRVVDVDNIAAKIFGAEKTLSLAQIWSSVDKTRIEKVAEEIKAAEEQATGRFIGLDGRSMMVVAQASSRANTSLVNQHVAMLRAEFASLPYGSEIRITGLPVLLAAEFPPLINQLRTGLLLAILLAVGVVGIAARSFALAFATLVPNLLPLLFAEAAIWFMGTNLDITSVIALTIAFGISIDNAVHVINGYNFENNSRVNQKVALQQALNEISPALLASTVIVCVAAIVTQFSAMPSVNNLGQLLIGTLIVALVSNLVVLPSYLLFLSRFRLFSIKQRASES